LEQKGPKSEQNGAIWSKKVRNRSKKVQIGAKRSEIGAKRCNLEQKGAIWSKKVQIGEKRCKLEKISPKSDFRKVLKEVKSEFSGLKWLQEDWNFWIFTFYILDLRNRKLKNDLLI
jgi:hypothetical protein